MQWTHPTGTDHGSSQPVDRIDFAMVRAVITARQNACRTARALAEAARSVADERASGGTASWFNGGRGINGLVAPRGNFHSVHRPSDHRGDGLCADLGKPHA